MRALRHGVCAHVAAFNFDCTGDSVRAVGHAKKEKDAKAADERLLMDKELHGLQCAKLRASTNTVTSSKLTRILEDIRDNYVVMQSFQDMHPPPQDMIDVCSKHIAALKTQLLEAQLAASSSTSFQSLSTTPLLDASQTHTPRASACVTPTHLNMNE